MLDDGQSVLREDVACFGALQDTEEMLEWEIEGSKGAIAGVKYYFEEVHLPFFEYLLTLPLVKAAVLEYNIGDVKVNGDTYKGYVYVSASVNGHHMLNVLSMFRTPVTFNHVLSTWEVLVDEGIDKRTAHVLCFHYRVIGGTVSKYRTASGEHSYFSSLGVKEALAQEVAYLDDEAPCGPNEELSEPFSVVGRYVRSDDHDYWEDEPEDGDYCGVAEQCIGYEGKSYEGTFNIPILCKESKYIDIDVAKEKAARDKYEASPKSESDAAILRTELGAAITKRGSEERPVSTEEAYEILSSLAQELLAGGV